MPGYQSEAPACSGDATGTRDAATKVLLRHAVCVHIEQVADLVESLAPTVLRLQIAAYAVEAALIGNDGIPGLHETVADLTSHRLCWLLARDDETLVGAAGYRFVRTGTDSGDGGYSPAAPRGVDECLDIDRLFVHPNAFRRGIGRALLTRLLVAAGSRSVSVSTGRDNHPARRLYLQHGFREVGEIEVVPGLFIVRYRYRSAAETDVSPNGQ